MIKKCAKSFAISAICGLLVILVIEVIVRMVTGREDFIPLSPEYVALFPSKSIAVEVDILLYGVIGAVFSGMTFIYEKDRIGFIIQNIIYFILTSIIWIPIVTFIWQLQKYPSALISTLCGFGVTYLIMSIVGYKTTKRDVEQINVVLERQN